MVLIELHPKEFPWMNSKAKVVSIKEIYQTNSYKTWKLLLSFSKIYVSHISLTDFSSIHQRAV